MTTSHDQVLLQSTIDEAEEILVTMLIDVIKSRRSMIVEKAIKKMKQAVDSSPLTLKNKEKSESQDFDASEDLISKNEIDNFIPFTSQTELNSQNINTYFHGWKELARYFGVTVRTLQRWDQELKIPWEKSHSGKNGRVKIHLVVADRYQSLLKQIRLTHDRNHSGEDSKH